MEVKDTEKVLRGVYQYGEEKLIAQAEQLGGRRQWVVQDWDQDAMYPLEYRTITTDVIRNYADAVSDINPLYRDDEYGKTTRWGGMVAPPMMVNKVAATFGQPHRLRDHEGIRVIDILNAGTTYYFYLPIRLGDHFRVKDVWYTGFEDKTRRDGTGDRNFLATSDRIFINQSDEVACVSKRRRMYLYGPPLAKGQPIPPRKTGPKYLRYVYTQEEMDYIDSVIDAEEIRGAEPRYWEDIKEGEELKPVAFRGLTDWDMAAMINQGEVPRNTTIWDHDYKVMNQWSRRRTNWWFDPSPAPKVSQCGASSHLTEEVAQWAGQPIPFTMGVQTDFMMCRLLTNWMGDDGFLKRFDTQNRLSNPNGDATFCEGKVIRRYVDGGQYLVDLAVWARNIRGYLRSLANCTVLLPSREVDKNAYKELKAGELFKD
ncbi:MAG: MaoC family dehydratase N-terminal domain-containing protein [Chloroflexota bacterium]